jgi:hypothetical protein
MVMCKHDMEGGCADCTAIPPAVSPRPEYQPDLGPWFAARYDGDCDGCGGDIIEGAQIRADGEGGWLCGICGHEGEEPAVQFCPVPSGDIRIVSWGPDYVGYAEQAKPSLAAFLDQYREGP